MSELILKGILTGLILSVMIGPVFFVLLETSIRRGIRAALAMDLGVLLSDVFYILIALFFYNEVEALSSGKDNDIIKLVGGIILIIFGLINFFKKVKMKQGENIRVVSNANAKDYILLTMKGFFLNMANPLVIFYWFAVITSGADNSQEESMPRILFYLTCILVTFFTIDILKIFGAKRLRPLVTKKVLVGLNRLIGIVFMAFGLFLILEKYVNV